MREVALGTKENYTLVKELAAAGCQFLIIGGAAVHFYVPERLFNDLDVVVPAERNAAQCLRNALQRFPTDVNLARLEGVDLSKPKSKIVLNMKLHADILIENTDYFREAYGKAVDALCLGLTVKVASKSTLLSNLQGIDDDKARNDIKLLEESMTKY
jgi:hypothetical protein